MLAELLTHALCVEFFVLDKQAASPHHWIDLLNAFHWRNID